MVQRRCSQKRDPRKNRRCGTGRKIRNPRQNSGAGGGGGGGELTGGGGNAWEEEEEEKKEGT